MDQMSGLRPVRNGTVAQVSGNVLIIQNASVSQPCVMETQTGLQTLHVLMDQMSGLRHVRPGSVMKAGGNVLMIPSASVTHWCVMDH